MLIRRVDARWLHCPIPHEAQHTSDFGRVASFDMTLVRVETQSGLVGWGEAKAAVGSAGACQAIVAAIEHDLGPQLIGEDARHINRLWDRMYSGNRFEHALAGGRTYPILGRRGLSISAISGIDMALWDLLGRSLGCPVVDLWGGARQARMSAYASGGWADSDAIGDQLQSYVDRGFRGVKMRVGAMDGDVDTSVARVTAAREALGPGVELMVDAHGTFSPTDAMRFAAMVRDLGLRWFEEPVNADDAAGAARVRGSTAIPIAAGESEFTRFAFRDLIESGAVDILQPDLAICGGPSEGRRIAALAETHQLELAPHCWGSALSFSAGVSLAFASSASRTIEYSLGANPLLHDLVDEPVAIDNGVVTAPTGIGLGVTPDEEFIGEFEVKP